MPLHPTSPRAQEREPAPVPERRVVTPAGGVRVLTRDAGGDGGSKIRTIVGHAAVFNTWTTLYESSRYVWRERVNPGAFARAIAEKQDVRSLWNHDARIILGRTVSGTCRLSEDATGLFQETDPPDTQLVRDLVIAPMDRGDVTQMSFAFMPRVGDTKVVSTNGVTVIERGGERITLREEDGRDVEERELVDVDLCDVSPVTYPQYVETDCSLRAAGERREKLCHARLGRCRRDYMRRRLALVNVL